MTKLGFSEGYCAGVDAGIGLLAKWQSLGEQNLMPPEVAQELRVEIDRCQSDDRRGMTDAIAAYLILCLGGSTPVLGQWDVLGDLAAWEHHYG